MGLMDTIKERARAQVRHIVLPEGNDKRIVVAATKAVQEKIAQITVLGNVDEIKKIADQEKVDLTGVMLLDPTKSDKVDACANILFEIRKNKGMTIEGAKQAVLTDAAMYAVLMIKNGDADGMVSGACHSTADTIRPALQVLKTAPGISYVSSCFIMDGIAAPYGENGAMVFADCAVIPNPDAEQLANIAVAAANSAKVLADIKQPKVAMLSFSTKGSAKDPLIDKVVAATKRAKELAPDLMLDGELQADAALVESVGALKCPGSAVAGKANVLVFPDLQAGNIGYKLVQRLAGVDAIGPILQGLAAPVNDLSRGCDVDEVVGCIAITVLQSLKA